MKKTFYFCILLALIGMNGVSNVAADTFDFQDIKTSLDTLKPPITYEEIIDPIREMPRFPGCEDLDISTKERKKCAEEKLLEFVYGNLKTPEILQQSCNIKGMAVISFTIDKEGNIIDPKIRRDIGGGFGEECLRVVRSMPQWIPAKEGGKLVAVNFNLPIRIKAGLSE